ncbi:MAG: DUF3276 family protein [Treponema sp.]|jgi:hypothetical protein|nr:DUF3276 family protein [Treponema sp.]
MGIRGEIFSTRVLLQNRTYFFNVKENRMGDLYLNIVESKNRDSGGFERQSVILFAEDLQDFLKGFDDSLKVLEKAIRERKKSGYRTDANRREGHENRGGDDDSASKPRRIVAKKRENRGGYREERSPNRTEDQDPGR